MYKKIELTAVDRVEDSESNESSTILGRLVDAVDTQGDVKNYACSILAAIDKMREDVPGVVVTSDAL